ncbi:hypothetical protein L1987_03478 [Smallanthus sonchifolius]|uniref:Uncharacterized protein n=1 Tax=Smallanthus sonchifolius TaxID=185202 RepID=A0ACB9KAV8_9ASTR|nr:hypothetical protein L1987_03478 [Smallanthus sonchifolius]
MAFSKNSFGVLVLQMMVVLAIFSLHAEGQGLKLGFYEKSCPHAEKIVSKVIKDVMAVAPSLSGPLLRMHFHDCFIRTKGPFWEVGTGRRYGKVSLFSDPINPVTGLPPFTANITALKQIICTEGTKHKRPCCSIRYVLTSLCISNSYVLQS